MMIIALDNKFIHSFIRLIDQYVIFVTWCIIIIITKLEILSEYVIIKELFKMYMYVGDKYLFTLPNDISFALSCVCVCVCLWAKLFQDITPLPFSKSWMYMTLYW